MPRPPFNRSTQNRLALARFLCTVFIAAFFAGLGSPDLQVPMLRGFLMIAAILTALLAMLQRERLLGRVLNRWDESVGYYALSVLCDIVWEQTTPE